MPATPMKSVGPKDSPAKKTKAPAPKTETVAVPGKKKGEEREVKFRRYEALFCCNVPEGHVNDDGSPIAEYDGPITVQRAKELLGWETEDEYAKRRLTQDPTLKENKLKFGAEYTLKDAEGNKVKCHNNSTNRPLNIEHCKKLRQDVLTKDWQMNCESIIISRTGIVLSGQHRLICLILAWEEWKKQAKWKQLWNDQEPIIESLVTFGASDDPKVLKTFDNVMPRSLGDVFYTSPLFMGKSQAARNKMADMMSKGVKLLWKRLNATAGGFIEKQTHAASMDFADRHQRLQGAVKHIHDEMGEESGNVFATMKLHTGACAAMLYLMGQSGTAPDKSENYHSLVSDHTERQLDWKRWDKALEFWTEMAKSPSAEKAEDQPVEWVLKVREALAGLDGDSGRGGTPRQRHAIIAIAWHKFWLKEKFEKDAKLLWPKMEIDPDKNRRVIMAGEEPVFGGADLGEQYDEENLDGDDTPDPEEVKATAAAEREKKMKATLDAEKPTVKASPDKKVIPNPTVLAKPNATPVKPVTKEPVKPAPVVAKPVPPKPSPLATAVNGTKKPEAPAPVTTEPVAPKETPKEAPNGKPVVKPKLPLKKPVGGGMGSAFDKPEFETKPVF